MEPIPLGEHEGDQDPPPLVPQVFGRDNRRRATLRALGCMIAVTGLFMLWRSSGAGFHPAHGALFGLVTIPLAFLEFAASARPRQAGRDGLLGILAWVVALGGLGGAYFQAPYTETLLAGGSVDDALENVSLLVEMMIDPKPNPGSLRNFAYSVMPGILAFFALAGALALLLRLRAFKSLPLPALACGAALTTLYPLQRKIEGLFSWLKFAAGYSLASFVLGGLIALGLLALYWLVDRAPGVAPRAAENSLSD